MTKKKKSQVTTELLIITAVVFILFLSIVLMINQKNSHVLQYRRYLSAKDIADRVAYAINDVFIAGFGSVNYLYLPSGLIDGTSFTLTIFPKQRLVQIVWNERHYVAPVLTANITGNLTLTEGRIKISNVLGQILLEE